MDNKDLLNEVSDFDQDIKKRQQLIEEAKKIPADASWSEAKSVVESLQKKWKSFLKKNSKRNYMKNMAFW